MATNRFLLSAVVVFVFASFVRAEVIDIQVINTSGQMELVGQQFFPSNDPNAHFSLATLNVLEDAGFPPPEGPIIPHDLLWWDLEVKVTRATSQIEQDVMISIDKDVLNASIWHWTDFHMTLGRGIGPGFVESDEFDNLWFKEDTSSTPPMEKTGAFKNPPMQDEAVAPDELWWFEDPPANPGVDPGGIAVFWVGINVPDAFFDPSTQMAVFTLRQHASIPEPSTLALLLMSGLGLVTVGRRRA